jgi:hypothetical protein
MSRGDADRRPYHAGLGAASTHRRCLATRLDRGLEGVGRRVPDGGGLRVPPQRGDLVALRLGTHALAGLLQVGRDGGDRVAPRAACALPAPAGHRSHRVRGPRAQPGPPEAAADGGREHDPGEGTTPSAAARQRADDLIWDGTVQILEHEQRALVQPNFDRLSCAFARLVSIGAATTFEVSGVRRELPYFTSFYLYSLTSRPPRVVRVGTWPRITRLEDRWWWLSRSVVPRFRRFAGTPLIDAILGRILAEARACTTMPCVPSLPEQAWRQRRTPAGAALGAPVGPARRWAPRRRH